MNVRNLVPLGLTIAIAASLAACGKNETAPAAGADAKPAFDLSQIKTPLISLNSADLDPSIAACTDLNGFVNSKWLKANPVPGDQTTWGSFEILRERSLEVQHALVQQAAASEAKAGSVEAKIGDIWKTGSDEAKIEAAGLAPLQPQLDKIAALGDTAAITQYLRDSQAEADRELARITEIPGLAEGRPPAGFANFDQWLSGTQLERELKSYVRQSRMSAIKLTPDKLSTGIITMRPLTEGEAAMMPLQIRSQRGVDAAEAATILAEARLVAQIGPLSLL